MSRKMRWKLATVVVLTGVLAVSSTTMAGADAGSADDVPWYLVPSEADGLSDKPLPEEYQDANGVSPETAQALLRFEVERPELGFAGAEWNEERGKLTLYAAGDSAAVAQAMHDLGASGEVEIAPALLSAAEKAEVSKKITGQSGLLSSGQQIVSVRPSIDGAVFDVVLDEQVQSRAEPRLPNVGVTINFSYDAAIEPATRNHNPTPQLFSGAYMHRSGSSCSTGFRMTELSTSTPAMASAHHCGVSLGEQWYYGGGIGVPVGTFQGGLYPGGAVWGDTSAWKGTGVADMVAGIFVGDHTVAGSGVFPIRGAVNPTVGTNVCYSGSRSGTVCGNKITATGISACYIGLSVCYYELAETQHISGVPAAGRGDSGGPVYQAISPQGPFAAGVISGIRNATPTCTGDPGATATDGRICSATVLYAPITEMFGHGYGLNYIPYTP